MALYEDFDLDITTTVKSEVELRGITDTSCNLACHTLCYSCADACSVTCGGMSNRPCDR